MVNSSAVSIDKKSSLKTITRELYQGLTSLFFPAICTVCDQRIDESKTVVCKHCWSALKVLSADIVEAKPTPEQLDAILPVFEFEDTIQKIIHGLKYSGYKSSGLHLGRLIAKRLSKGYLLKESILMPVPLHPNKKRERGYNQSLYIARGIAEITGNIIRDDVLKRVKNTITQTHLNAHERHENMRDAFAINRCCDLSGITSVVLIDDVFTTGATMNAAAAVLKSSGVVSVCGLTAAAPI
ncbi:MAG: ComF family protein [Candidatus Marinimicrobia bacterium]|nr:ComF family protein [Candidatus Neomarinimicrobiota bacterium]